MAKNMNELGFTGLSQWGGRITEDFLREWRGKEGYKRANEMRLNSPTVNALLTAIKLSIRKSKWQLVSEVGDEDPRLELLSAALENMRYAWDDHISQALTMLPFGFALFEIIYERVGGQILWRKFAQRSQDTIERWDIDDKGGINGCWQVSNTNFQEVYLPIDKLLLYRTETEKNNPEGRSILRSAWVPYYYMKNLQMLEGIGYERYAAGMPVIKLPHGADTSDSDDSDAGLAKKIVRNIRMDEQMGVVLPEGWELELLSANGSAPIDVSNAIQRYKKDILMNSLAQFLALGLDNTGAYSLSKDMTDLFVMSVNAVMDTIATTFSKHAIPRLLRLNGLDDTGIQYIATPAGDTDLTEIATFIQQAGGYITWTPEDQLVLREMLGLPEVDLDSIIEIQETERAIADARTQAMTENFRRREEMGVTTTATPTPFEIIDEISHARQESKLQKRMTNFFEGQKKRVAGEAQQVKREG